MDKLRILYLLLVCCVILGACSGKDKITIDKIPPTKPVLIPHLGDLGDFGTSYTDDNNGIDAVPDGDWFRVSWEHLLDTDLDYIKVYRFDEFDLNPIIVDSIAYNNDFYVDSSNSLSTDKRYSYFIEVVDDSGNSTISDTVSYKLISKQILTSPSNGAYQDYNNITLSWQKSGFVSKFRILVFDDNNEYLWSRDIQVSFEGDFFDSTLPSNLLQNYTGNAIYWRVDAFDWDSELGYEIGSESNERVIYLNQRK
jgi:hypothetical protein